MWKIVCIGAGRLAYHLMPRLEHSGHQVVQVYNRTPEHAAGLITKLHQAEITDTIDAITPDADLYFFTLRDDVMPEIAARLTPLEDGHRIFLHCSGVAALDALPFTRRGSFYPLQSFSYAHEVPWEITPILITAELPDVRKTLISLASTITQSVYTVSDDQKSRLHLAAVFANNFTNHMLALAEKICKDHGLSFDILKPLIQETCTKALDVGPGESQTGPAIRRDEKTIDKHLDLLQYQPQLAEIYRLITESIKREK